MKEIFVTTIEEYEELQIEYNLEECGMSGKYYGWNWSQDDNAKVIVYFKLEE